MVVAIVSLGVGLMVGAVLPDVDLAPVLPVRHRSAWTHGPWFGLGLAWAAQQWPVAQWAVVGLLAGLALHLLNDASPKSWRGAARINLYPLPASLPAVLSWLYITVSAVVALWLFVQSVQKGL